MALLSVQVFCTDILPHSAWGTSLEFRGFHAADEDWECRAESVERCLQMAGLQIYTSSAEKVPDNLANRR